MKQTSVSKGFTLIELLIVVAIIAILAAIAVPNFLEAQTRSKVSRAKSDMRTYATAIESYFVDYNSYVPCSTYGIPGRGVNAAAKPVLERLSTPIAYLTSGILPNPFNAKQRIGNADAQGQADAPNLFPLTADELANPAYSSFMYQSGNDDGRTAYSGSSGNPAMPGTGNANSNIWFLHSPGPNQLYHNMGGVLANSSLIGGNANSNLDQTIKLIYDPTNGTISSGAIWRVGGQHNSNWGHYMAKAITTQK